MRIISLAILLSLSLSCEPTPMQDDRTVESTCPNFEYWREIDSPFNSYRCFARTLGLDRAGLVCLPTTEVKLKPCANPVSLER